MTLGARVHSPFGLGRVVAELVHNSHLKWKVQLDSGKFAYCTDKDLTPISVQESSNVVEFRRKEQRA